LIRDLDSDEFTVREKASKELEHLGSDALPALRQVLKEGPSAETRHRVARLLAQRHEAPFVPCARWSRGPRRPHAT
jgi:hypothetical protein